MTDVVAPHYGLYPYQRDVLLQIVELLSTSGRRVVAHLPTGAGKTRVATHAACHLLNDQSQDDRLVIWLAATEELCSQAADELAIGWSYLGRRTASVYRYWGRHSLALSELSTGFLVTGLSKLRSAANRDDTLLATLAHRAAGVVFDEAHQAVAETYRFITEQLSSCRPPLLGLTATPGRSSTIGESDYELARLFNQNKVSIDPRGYDSPVEYLIRNRFLARPTFIPIDFDSSPPIKEPLPAMDYRPVDLGTLGGDDARNRAIVDVAFNAGKRHLRTIVFCPSVKSAEACNSMLSALGIVTDVITAKTPVDERKAIIEVFKGQHRSHMVLFNYGVLTAGFDAPRTRCVIVARPTTSLVLYSQMVGRGLRGPRSGGNTSAEIFTVVDTTLPGFGTVVEAFRNWEELWSMR